LVFQTASVESEQSAMPLDDRVMDVAETGFSDAERQEVCMG
jgi:hypothetical protein